MDSPGGFSELAPCEIYCEYKTKFKPKRMLSSRYRTCNVHQRVSFQSARAASDCFDLAYVEAGNAVPQVHVLQESMASLQSSESVQTTAPAVQVNVGKENILLGSKVVTLGY